MVNLEQIKADIAERQRLRSDAISAQFIAENR
jgi:hypothetical protein